MISSLATLLTHPLDITGSTLWMMFPLSIVVVVVYKTIRVVELRSLPRQILRTGALVLGSELALLLLGWAYLMWLH